jgi:phospholipid/cholesterol/gamma-HCH transport system substrate-binding protein
MRRNVMETVMGAVVLAVAAYFLFFSYTSASLGTTRGYVVRAKFDQTGGLSVGAPVRISGIKVGTITAQTLDPKTFLAVLELTIENDIQLPVDTTAKIASESLLGGKYLLLDPGGDERMIKPNGELSFTQSAVNLEDLIGRFMFSGGSTTSPDAATPAPAPGAK